MQPTELLFVYGTLLHEGRLRFVVGEASRWHRLGSGTIAGRLYNVGPYPALRLSRRAHELVPGMVLEFCDGRDALACLDQYEDVAGGLYVRQRVVARLSDNGERQVWVYVYNRSVRRLPRIERWPPPSRSRRP